MISERLRTLRKRSGMKQYEVAEKLGVEPNTYCRYEQGIRIPATSAIAKLAEIFNVTPDDIYGVDKKDADRNRGILTTAEHLQQYFYDLTGREATSKEFEALNTFIETYIKGLKK